jgi:ferredoxin
MEKLSAVHQMKDDKSIEIRSAAEIKKWMDSICIPILTSTSSDSRDILNFSSSYVFTPYTVDSKNNRRIYSNKGIINSMEGQDIHHNDEHSNHINYNSNHDHESRNDNNHSSNYSDTKYDDHVNKNTRNALQTIDDKNIDKNRSTATTNEHFDENHCIKSNNNDDHTKTKLNRQIIFDIDQNSNENDKNNTSSNENKNNQIYQTFNTEKINKDHDYIIRNKSSHNKHNTNYNGQEYIDIFASIGMIIPSEKRASHDENSRHNASISRLLFKPDNINSKSKNNGNTTDPHTHIAVSTESRTSNPSPQGVSFTDTHLSTAIPTSFVDQSHPNQKQTSAKKNGSNLNLSFFSNINTDIRTNSLNTDINRTSDPNISVRYISHDMRDRESNITSILKKSHTIGASKSPLVNTEISISAVNPSSSITFRYINMYIYICKRICIYMYVDAYICIVYFTCTKYNADIKTYDDDGDVYLNISTISVIKGLNLEFSLSDSKKSTIDKISLDSSISKSNANTNNFSDDNKRYINICL